MVVLHLLKMVQCLGHKDFYANLVDISLQKERLLENHSLFLSGLSMRAVAPIVGVTVQSVSRWLKKWHPTYMREIGAKSQISNTNKKELLSHLNLDEDDEIMVISTPLPSGATIHSVIQIPVGIKKSLKE